MLKGTGRINEEAVQDAIMIQKHLDERRSEFARQQDILLKEKVTKNEEMAKKKEGRIKSMLTQSKSIGGPFTESSELEEALEGVSKIEKKKALRNEISLRKLLNPDDAVQRKHLYGVNKLTVQELMTNLSQIIDSPEADVDDDQDDSNFDPDWILSQIIN